MGYKKETVTLDEAKDAAAQYPYVLVYKISEVCLGKTADIPDPWEEMLEARFFSEDGELHIFRCEKDWQAVRLTDDADPRDTNIRRYRLANRFLGAGNTLVVKDYLAADEDGQVYIEQTRLCDIMGGKSDVL